jgi:hypothetical protein
LQLELTFTLALSHFESADCKTIQTQKVTNEVKKWEPAQSAGERLFSFKSTGGVTRDSFYLFDISAAAEILRDTPRNSTFELKILPFLQFLGSLGAYYVTA